LAGVVMTSLGKKRVVTAKRRNETVAPAAVVLLSRNE